MIKVNCVVSNGLIERLSIKGHADYDTLGKDIVCAAVYSIVTTTINNIIALEENTIKYDTKEGNVCITVLRNSDVTNKLLNVLIDMLKELATDYPQNIKIGGLK